MSSEAVVQRAERIRLAAKRELEDAAFAVFAERGYHATRIADITAHMGVGQSTFYKHFDSKRDVVESVLDQRMVAVLDALGAENAAAAADTLEEYIGQVRRIGVALFATLTGDPRALRVMVFEAASVDRELGRRWQGLLAVAHAVIASYYRNGVEKGYFHAELDVDAHSDAVVGLLIGGLLRVLRDPDDLAGQKQYAASVLDMIVGSAAVVLKRSHGEDPR